MTTDDSTPTVKVTLATIYDKLLEVDKKVDPVPAHLADHEVRIRALEVAQAAHDSARTPRSPIAAIAAAIAAGLGALISLISNFGGNQ